MGADLNSLEGVIRHTKRTILYFHPLDDPAPIKRVWCLYEILTVATTEGNELTLGFSSSGKKEMYKIAAAFAKLGTSTVVSKDAKQPCLSQKRAPSAHTSNTHPPSARVPLCTHRKLQRTIEKLDSKKAQATVPADADMIKSKIVKIFRGHKQFDLKLREALTAAVAGYTSHVELVAACRALDAGDITASGKRQDARKALVETLGRAGKRLVPTDPIDLKCTHLDLSGMGLTREHLNGLAQLLRCDVNGSLTELNLHGFALPVKQLKGTDPVESLDLSKKELSFASAIIIASCIKENGVLKELKCSPLAPLALAFVSAPIDSRQHPPLPPCSQSLGKRTRL